MQITSTSINTFTKLSPAQLLWHLEEALGLLPMTIKMQMPPFIMNTDKDSNSITRMNCSLNTHSSRWNWDSVIKKSRIAAKITRNKIRIKKSNCLTKLSLLRVDSQISEVVTFGKSSNLISHPHMLIRMSCSRC